MMQKAATTRSSIAASIFSGPRIGGNLSSYVALTFN